MTVVNPITQMIDDIVRRQTEYTEKTLAEIITNYDFIVGSKECKYRLMEILPEGANIICSPYIASPTMIYAIKKFDIMDLIMEEKSCSNCKFWCLDKNDENRRCKYCYHQDEWQAESEDMKTEAGQDAGQYADAPTLMYGA